MDRPFVVSLERKFKRVLTSLLRALLSRRQGSTSDLESFQRILVIRQHNQLGDMLCAVPLLRALRAHLPKAFICLMASPVNAGVMANNRYIDELLTYDKRRYLGERGLHLQRLWSFLREIRSRRFDMAIVPATVSMSFTSDLLAYCSGARVRVGAESLQGVTNPSGFCFTHPVDLEWSASPGRHQTLRNLDILSNWAIRAEDLTPEITLNQDEIDEVNSKYGNKLAGVSRVVSLHVGAGKPPNRWPVERFIEVSKTLANDRKTLFLIIEGPMDREPVSEFLGGLSGMSEMDLLHIAGTPIRQVAAVLSKSHLLISNDTGIMHVGAAVGVPVLSIFGPTDPRQWAPLGTGHRFIKSEGDDIRDVTTESVLRIAREMLLIDSGAGREDFRP